MCKIHSDGSKSYTLRLKGRDLDLVREGTARLRREVREKIGPGIHVCLSDFLRHTVLLGLAADEAGR